MNKAAKEPDAPAQDRTPSWLERKYGKEILSYGYTTIPNMVIDNMGKLGLEPQVMLCAIILFRFWWVDAQARPKMQTIAVMMNRSRRQVRRYVSTLRELELVTTTQRYDGTGGKLSNEFDCHPIIMAILKRVQELAEAQAAQEANPATTGDTRNDTNRLPMSYGMGHDAAYAIGHRVPNIKTNPSKKDSFDKDDSNLRSAAALTQKEGFLAGSSGYTNQQNTEKSNASYNHDSKENRNRNNRKGKGAAGGAPHPSQSPGLPNSQAPQRPVEPGERIQLPIHSANILSDISDGFHDLAPRSSQTQAANYWESLARRGMSERQFGELLYETRAITNQSAVSKTNRDGTINRMAYFMSVLRNRTKDIIKIWDEEDRMNEIVAQVADDLVYGKGGNPYEQ